MQDMENDGPGYVKVGKFFDQSQSRLCFNPTDPTEEGYIDASKISTPLSAFQTSNYFPVC